MCDVWVWVWVSDCDVCCVVVGCRTPLHMASAYGVEALVDSLVTAGADVNTKNSLTWTPLQVSQRDWKLGLMRACIGHGKGRVSVLNVDATPPASA